MKSRILELLRQGVASSCLHEACCHHKGGKGGSAPPAPDYTGAAREQAAASQENTLQQTYANRPSQQTPWGQTNWQTGSTIDPSTGKPVTTWTQQETLDPKLQQALDEQLGIQSERSQLAGSFMDRVRSEYASPFSYAGMTGLAGTPQAGAGLQGQLNTAGLPAMPGNMEQAQQEAYGRMQKFQAPQRAEEAEALRTRLANMGHTGTGSAYASALRQQGDQFARQDLQNLQASFGEGRDQGQYQAGLRQQGFGEALQGGQFANLAQQQGYGQQMQSAEYQNRLRQQQIAEEAQRRGMSLNEMNALLTGQQVQSPQMPGFQNAQQAQAPNLLGAQQALGSYNLQAQQNAQSGGMDWGSAIGGIGSIAAVAM